MFRNKGLLAGHDKFSMPPIEKFQPGVDYAFSISSSEQFHGEPLRLQKFYNHFITHVVSRIPHCDFKLYLEISTKSQNYHYHGFISFPSYMAIIEFYQIIKYSLEGLCTMEIDTIKDYHWQVYVVKQRHIMEPYCFKNYIPYKIKSRKEYKVVSKVPKMNPLDV